MILPWPDRRSWYSCTVPDFCSGGTRFEFRQPLFSFLRVSMFYLSPLGSMPECCFHPATAALIRYSQVILEFDVQNSQMLTASRKKPHARRGPSSWTWRRMFLFRTGVSEEHVASISLLVTAIAVPSSLVASAPNMGGGGRHVPPKHHL
jgi:hypothetical protein